MINNQKVGASTVNFSFQEIHFYFDQRFWDCISLVKLAGFGLVNMVLTFAFWGCEDRRDQIREMCSKGSCEFSPTRKLKTDDIIPHILHLWVSLSRSQRHVQRQTHLKYRYENHLGCTKKIYWIFLSNAWSMFSATCLEKLVVILLCQLNHQQRFLSEKIIIHCFMYRIKLIVDILVGDCSKDERLIKIHNYVNNLRLWDGYRFQVLCQNYDWYVLPLNFPWILFLFYSKTNRKNHVAYVLKRKEKEGGKPASSSSSRFLPSSVDDYFCCRVGLSSANLNRPPLLGHVKTDRKQQSFCVCINIFSIMRKPNQAGVFERMCLGSFLTVSFQSSGFCFPLLLHSN